MLAYLFHRVARRLDGRPTLILVDEAWLALDDPAFGAQLEAWLGTVRKKNGSVVLSTLSLAQVEKSAIASSIAELCLTRIFLPTAWAMDPQGAATYRRFGFNDRQIEMLARATPKRDYCLRTAAGDRLFELDLGPVALAFCAAASKPDQTAIGGFARAWLVHRGLAWAADLLPGEPGASTPFFPETL